MWLLPRYVPFLPVFPSCKCCLAVLLRMSWLRQDA